MLTGIGLDDQPGVVLHQLQQFALHRYDAADDDGALCIDDGFVAEYLGETVVHALGYLLVLFHPEGCQFTVSVFGFLSQRFNSFQGLLAYG